MTYWSRNILFRWVNEAECLSKCLGSSLDVFPWCVLAFSFSARRLLSIIKLVPNANHRFQQHLWSPFATKKKPSTPYPTPSWISWQSAFPFRPGFVTEVSRGRSIFWEARPFSPRDEWKNSPAVNIPQSRCLFGLGPWGWAVWQFGSLTNLKNRFFWVRITPKSLIWGIVGHHVFVGKEITNQQDDSKLFD